MTLRDFLDMMLISFGAAVILGLAVWGINDFFDRKERRRD